MWAFETPAHTRPPVYAQDVRRTLGLSALFVIALLIILATAITQRLIIVFNAQPSAVEPAVTTAPRTDLSLFIGLALLLSALVTFASAVIQMLVGKAMRVQTLQINAGPLACLRTSHGFRLRLAWIPLGSADHIFAITGRRYLWARRLLLALVGPLIYLLIGAVAWRLVDVFAPVYAKTIPYSVNHVNIVYGPPTYPGHPLISLMCYFIALWSVARGVVSLLPMSAGSDGMTIVRMLNDRRATSGESALSVISGLAWSGVRPREWPQDLLDLALSSLPAGGDFAFHATQLAYWAALDRGDIGKAEAHLRALSPAPPRWQQLVPAIAAEVAYMNARWLGDHEQARLSLLLATVYAPKDAVSVWLRTRAEAAVALLEGRPADARALAAAGLMALEQTPEERYAGFQFPQRFSKEPVASNLRELLAMEARTTASAPVRAEPGRIIVE